MSKPAFPEASKAKGQAFRYNYQALPGSEIEPMPGAHIAGVVCPRRCIEVTIVLRSRPRPAEERVVTPEEIGAMMPHERHYLTREALARSRGADPADVLEVTRFADQHGLRVIGEHLAARMVHLSGTVADFSQAFRTHLAVYRYAGGLYRGRTSAVHIPLILQGVVHGVFGLDNRPAARPHFKHKRHLGGGWAHALGVSYSPVDVAKIYNFPTDANGTGECIGIIELGGGFRRSDLAVYFSKLGIPLPNVRAIPVNGGANRPTGNPDGPDGEVMLDIEIAGAVAPGAKIVVYFAPNTNQGFLRAINRAIHDRINQPSVISISWGGPESSWTLQALNAFNQSFQDATTLGVTVCAAAGDGGSTDGVPGRVAHVDFPASSPYVLACGGTSLLAAGGSITSETVWNDGPPPIRGGGGGSGGGGISEIFALPTWQAKAGVPPSINPGGRVGRGSPDVSADADEDTGYRMRVDGVDTISGGTSAVAPLLSGLIALLNQKIGTPVGYLNPLLYTTVAEAGAFHDITEGNNDMTGLVGGYKAGPGWDAASGLGSPDGGAIMAALWGPKKEATPATASAPATAASPVLSSPVGSLPAPREEQSASRKLKKEA